MSAPEKRPTMADPVQWTDGAGQRLYGVVRRTPAMTGQPGIAQVAIGDIHLLVPLADLSYGWDETA